MQVLQSPITNNAAAEELFKDVDTFCMFIGFPRSGHSLIGALLDAHPNIIIGHELNVLKRLYEGLNETEIYSLLLENSRSQAEVGRKSKYTYSVPNQWQGRSQELQVIGDKQGGASTRFIAKHPDSLQRLRDTISLKIKFIQVIRNPYDNISTIASRKNWSLEESTGKYFSWCEYIENIKKEIAPSDLFMLRHESFIDSPQVLLKELCHFLAQDAPDDYLSDCASIVYQSPHRSRQEAQWDHTLIDTVRERMSEFAFLQGYSFET